MRTFTKDSQRKAGTTKRAASPARKFPSKTPEQRAAEAREYRERLQAAVAELTTTQQWQRYLTQMALHRGYSANNAMLIWLQRPDATVVTTLKNWNKAGRRVAKGERSIKIFGRPRVLRKAELDEKTGEQTIREWIHWPLCSVFDVTQTEGEALVDIAPDLIGRDPGRIWERGCTWLESQGWNVHLKSIPGATKGYTDHRSRDVVVEETLGEAARAAVLLHELAHVLLHADLAPGEYQQHRGRCEVEAEGAAFVAAAMLGFDTTLTSVGYVASWARGNAARVAEAAAAIQTTGTRIADILDGTQTTEADDAAGPEPETTGE